MSAPLRYASVTQIGAFTALDPSFGDYLAIDPERCSGGGGPPQRVTVEPSPVGDGALIFPTLDDAWIVTLGGDLVVTSNGQSSEGGYFAALDTLYASLKTALDALKSAPDDLVHSHGTEQVWRNSEITDEWTSFWTVAVTFRLAVDVL